MSFNFGLDFTLFILILFSIFHLIINKHNFKSDFNIINPNENISDYIESNLSSIYLSFKINNLNSGDI